MRERERDVNSEDLTDKSGPGWPRNDCTDYKEGKARTCNCLSEEEDEKNVRSLLLLKYYTATRMAHQSVNLEDSLLARTTFMPLLRQTNTTIQNT
jgi:hypothetical protein